MDFSDKVFLITGASKGIGNTLANILFKYNAQVIGVYNKTKFKAHFDTFKCDLKKENDIKKLFNFIKEKYGKLDCLVNCAALTIDNDIYEKSKREFMEVLEVNLVGTFLMCKYASLLLERGIIINISSTDAIDTYNTYGMDYAASKAGLNNLTKTLALRFPSLKICALAPNWVDTESIREMDPEYLKQELARIGQKKLLTKEEVALKIIELIINDDYVSGSIVRMDDSNE